MANLTLLLDAARAEDPTAAAELLPLVYNELRRLAAHRLSKEAPGNTLQPTALVHEAYLRLIGDKNGSHWENRGHFFAAASEAMRRILVDEVRRKRSLKRGGGKTRRVANPALLPAPEPREDVLALDEALTELEASEPITAQVVQLRYFGGLTIPEAAEVLQISSRTANRHWTYARAWLHQRLKSTLPKGDPG
ncbi:MAG TPA: sigma-70 family RNA polymerase sigma factor [Gemmataceae bacterium]|nr:sigma-70 family RNA polymerase sigma factor [Gemmataceae bacterium]